MEKIANPDSREITNIADGLEKRFKGKETGERLAIIRDKINKSIETGFTKPFFYDDLYNKKRVSLRTDLEMLRDGEADMLEKCLLFHSIATKCGFECEFTLLLHPKDQNILMGATMGVKEGKKTVIIDPNNRPREVLERFPPRTHDLETFTKKFLLERRETDPIKLIARERLLVQTLPDYEYWVYCPPQKKKIEITINRKNHGIWWPTSIRYVIYGIITGKLKKEYKIPGTEIKVGPGPLLKHTIIDPEHKKAATSFKIDYEILKNPQDAYFKKLLEGCRVEFYENDEDVEKIIRNYVNDPLLVGILDKVSYEISNEKDGSYA